MTDIGQGWMPPNEVVDVNVVKPFHLGHFLLQQI